MRDSNTELRLNTEAVNELQEYDGFFNRQSEISNISLDIRETPLKKKKKVQVASIDIAHLTKKSVSLRNIPQKITTGKGL